MKKLAFLFVALISLIVVTGCNQTRKDVTYFSPEKENEVIEEVKEDESSVVEDVESDESEEEGEEEVKFAITSLEKNFIESDKGYHLIQGTTPKNTDKIVVDDYTLTKYKPGDTEWSYVAAVSLGTLKKGENNYTIRALDAEGSEIASESFTIVYDGIASGVLVSTGNNLTFIGFLTIIGIFVFYGFRRRFQ